MRLPRLKKPRVFGDMHRAVFRQLALDEPSELRAPIARDPAMGVFGGDKRNQWLRFRNDQRIFVAVKGNLGEIWRKLLSAVLKPEAIGRTRANPGNEPRVELFSQLAHLAQVGCADGRGVQVSAASKHASANGIDCASITSKLNGRPLPARLRRVSSSIPGEKSDSVISQSAGIRSMF